MIKENRYYITKAYSLSHVPIWYVRKGVAGQTPLGPCVFETENEAEALAYLKEVSE